MPATPAPKSFPARKKIAAALAAAVLIGSPLAAGVATANEAPPTTVDAVLVDYLAEYGAGNLESIMTDHTGTITIRAAESSIAEFAAGFEGVEAEVTDGPAATLSSTDVVGGEGFLMETATGPGTCSIGFNGFNAAGEAAIITAGHCTDDGRAPSATMADSGEHLGTFGFSQFGGPGNSTDWVAAGTDVAVIDGVNTTFNQPAQVTGGGNPADTSAALVTGVGEAFAGIPICKDGAETGHTCGTVEGEGVFVSAGSDGETRMVQGFYSTDLIAGAGDSGGPIMAGTTAVGMISAGGGGVTYGVSLSDALAHTDDYTVKVALNAPQITTTAPILRSADVTGTVAGAPEGTTVTVAIDGKPIETTVDEEGYWSVKAPNVLGTFDVTAQAKSGFSESEITTGSVEVMGQPATEEPVVDAPVVDEPATGGDAVDLPVAEPVAPPAPEQQPEKVPEVDPVPAQKIEDPKPVVEKVIEPVVQEPVIEPKTAEEPEVIKPIAEEPAVIVTTEEQPVSQNLPQPQATAGALTAGAAGIAAALTALAGTLAAGVRRLRKG